MAFPIEFPEQNFTWKGYPAHNDSPDVEDLPAYHEKATGRTISCWHLNEDELAEVQRTGKVWLNVWGGPHPPVVVMGEHPFTGGGSNHLPS